MKTIITASMGRNGVIGRMSKECMHAPEPGREPSTQAEFDRAVEESGWCPYCGGAGRVPANDVPWSYPEIDAHFERETKGHAVIMGRRTWEARGGQALKGRTNVVVSSQLFGELGELTAGRFDRDVLDDLEDDLAKRCVDKLFVIGGVKLFAAALPLADELDLTLIDREYEGDVYFPKLEAGFDHSTLRATFGSFECVERRQGSTPELTFTRWVRR